MHADIETDDISMKTIAQMFKTKLYSEKKTEIKMDKHFAADR